MLQLSNQNTMKPLHVDTDIEYDLDMTLFPGWDNPTTRAQPTLMVHQDEDCGCNSIPTDDLHNLIESCVDLECSESDSFIDDILDDSTDDSSVYFTTPYSDEDSSNSFTSSRSSFTSTEDSLDELLTGIVPISDNVTPDITRSLLCIEDQGSELTTLSNTHNDRKGVKRRLFSCELDDGGFYPAKRQRVDVFNCEDEVIFSVLKDLFNNIQDSV